MGGSPKNFILLGVSDRPWLELPLFVVLLVSYVLAMLGNISIILVSCLIPSSTAPCTSSLATLLPGPLLYHHHCSSDAGQHGSSSKTISYSGCNNTAYLHWLGCTECAFMLPWLWTAYVAICAAPPIYHYHALPSLPAASGCVWPSGLATPCSRVLTVQLPFCGLTGAKQLLL